MRGAATVAAAAYGGVVGVLLCLVVGACTVGFSDFFREPLVLLAVATLAPIIRDAFTAALRGLGRAGEDKAAKTPETDDDAKAHTRRVILEAIADAMDKGDTAKAGLLLEAFFHPTDAGGAGGAGGPSGGPAAVPK